ncbi:MAG TPA: glucoamylase family protein, partial [Tepidisphaeraceae bacterium]|nr:glucoamylase family protein [Tepidisphaeraceae bacterium]
GLQEHGTFYHWVNMRTGAREWKSEVSNIDTALLIAGVLTARQYFPDTELAKLANELYDNVDWTWLLKPDGTLCMGWHPEDGFINATWGQFNEGPLIYLLGLGSPTHPLPASSWAAWKRDPVTTYAGLTYMHCAPLFTHQYPECWFDLRDVRDEYADYFRDSQLATIAQRQWTANDLSKEFSDYGPNMWGLTASDSEHGYTAWGGPPKQGRIDGSVVPAASAGSLGFEPRICLDALEYMKQQYGDKAYLKYGFVDAFNPENKWYNKDVISIDVGPTVLMAENCRSGFVWKVFMSSPEMRAALKKAGFRSLSPEDKTRLSTTSLFEKGNNLRRVE